MGVGEVSVRGALAPRLALAAVLLGAAGLCLTLNWPGHFSYDSVVQLAEGRTGEYAGDHPPVMSWLLGIADALWRGAAPFVILDVALVWGSLLALALAAGRVSWLAVALAALAAFLPQLIIYPAIVWKDVLFAGSLLAAFACLAWVARLWARPAWRWPLLGAMVGGLTLAALARQNGAVALVFGAGAVAWIAATSGDGWRRGALYGAGVLAAVVALTLGANAALATRLDDGPAALAGQWESLDAFDIVGAVVRDPKVDLPVLRAEAPWLERLIRTEGAAAYSPVRVGSLEPMLGAADARGDAAALLARQWRNLILTRPLLYLRVRATAFHWVLMTPSPDDCVMVETGVEGPADAMADAGLEPRESARDDLLADYAFGFADYPVFRHGFYAAVAVILLAVLLRRRRLVDIAVAGLLASVLAFAASFALISISCDYRYLYALDAATLGAALYVAASLRLPGRRSPAPQAGTTATDDA